MILNLRKRTGAMMLCLIILVCATGVTKAKAETIPNGYTIIDKSNAGAFVDDKINQLIRDGVKNIYIKNGTYNIDDMIRIDKADVNIIGEDKNNTKLIQTKVNCDSIGVLNTNNVSISDLTIDNSKSGWAGFVEANSDNVTLKNCIVYGDDSTFAVYFAGKNYPTAKSTDPVKGLENSDMDTNNKMINNTVYSGYWGDGVSFSVQKNGLVENNTVNGTRIAFYVCRDSQVINNNIKNSLSTGIFVSIPSENDTISGNVIENSKASGIKISAETEYPVDENYSGHNINITNNTIKNSRYMGIEVDKLENSSISNNNIDMTDNIGLYLLRSNKLSITGNAITNSGYSKLNGNVWGWNENLNSAMLLDYKVTNSTISNNTITNNDFNCPLGIKEFSGNLNQMNAFSSNVINGNFTYPCITLE